MSLEQLEKSLEQMDKDFVLQTYKRNYINFKKGKNAFLYDENENEYIDFTSGIGVVSVGHGNERVANAIFSQIKNITHISNLYLIEPQVKVAKKLVELSKYDMKCFFANSGAEANEGAIKIARKYGEVKGEPKRYKIITLQHSFHGRTITALKATGQEKMHNYFGPYPDGFVYADNLTQIESLCDEHTIAVMIELVQGEGGVEPQNKQEVQKLSKFLKQKDILLIIDEVQTGIYRTGELFASNLYDINPDIITAAKGLGGGVPIGVIMTSHKDILGYGDHGSTFGGNYLSTTASLEVLSILSELKDSAELNEIFIYFEQKLKELVEKYDFCKKEVGLGMMRGIRVENDSILAKVIDAAFKERVLILKAGRSTIRFLPPLTISKKEIDEGFERLDKAFATI